MADKIRSALKRNILTALLLSVAFGLAYVLRQPISLFPSMVDWTTIVTLAGLLLITTGIKESGMFYLLAYRMARKIENERILALFLVFLAAIFSTFLTNDIALFIVVPLTLTLQEIVRSDYSKIIIFEALGVNAGSSLTPIGNPQNIFLWHQWGISFPGFVKEMAPLVLIMGVWLLLSTLACFSPRKIQVRENSHQSVDRGLFILSLGMLAAFIIATERGYGLWFLPVVFLSMTLIKKDLLFRCDWGLIVFFMAVFVDVHLACQLQPIRQLFGVLDLHQPGMLFLSGALLSQVISNVPAAILLAHHSADFKMIAYGVNIGGNGLVIGSFANLIALRFCKGAKTYLIFHLFSLPYFLVTLSSVVYSFHLAIPVISYPW